MMLQKVNISNSLLVWATEPDTRADDGKETQQKTVPNLAMAPILDKILASVKITFWNFMKILSLKLEIFYFI